MNKSVRRHYAVVAFLSLAALACVLPLHLSASVVVVVPAGNVPCKSLTMFNSITAAVSAVPPGSTIYVCPGTYAEQITINKRLTLVGVAGNGQAGPAASGANNPVIVPPSGGVIVNASDLFGSFPTAAQILVQNPGGMVSISNLTVDGSNNLLSGCGTDLVGIYYQNASGSINHVVTRFQELSQSDFGCQDGLAIYVQSGYGTGGTANVTIQNSSVHDYDKNGITADGSGTTATISGNYVVGIGATGLIAQNGIQVSFGATGKVMGNTVTDDVYISPQGGPYFSATGILLFDSGGTSGSHLVVSGNTVGNTQGAIVAFTDGGSTADYNDVSLNKITTSPAAGPFQLDGIDLCSNNNTATSNTVFNSSGSGVHIDGQCTEPGGGSANSGFNTSLTNNTVNEACAGVLTGPGTGTGTGNSVSGTVTFNVVQVIQSGDACPAGSSRGQKKSTTKPHPWRPRS